MRRRDDRPSIRDEMARFERQRRRMMLAIVAVWAAMLIGVTYLIAHPEVIGWYAGRVANGFRAADVAVKS